MPNAETRGGRRPGAGRPPKPRREKQSARVTLSLTQAEHRALKRAAAEAKTPAATHARDLLLRGLSRRR